MRCLVTYPFFVKRGGRIYEVGETFEGTERKVAQLVKRGLVAVPADTPKPPDLSGLTNTQLLELCAERGIKAPRKATKAQLLDLLGE